MIMTYDWLLWANRNSKLKKEIEDALTNDTPNELLIDDMFKITFDPQRQLVTVEASSEESSCSYKIAPKKLSYYLVKEVINGNWEAFNDKNIFDIDNK